MSWKEHFQRGVSYFKTGKHEEALKSFNEALRNDGEDQYIIYDSRAAAYEKLNRPKDALRDAKKAIDLAPEKWQGYSRAARLFFKTHKFEAASKMVDMAVERVKPEDSKRKIELSNFKQEIEKARVAQEEYLRRKQNQFLKLPMELFVDIAKMLLDQDHAYFIRLLHICKSWRVAILNIPSLWHTLVLNKRRLKDKAKLWVQHSKGRIKFLKISIFASENVQDWWPYVQNLDWRSIHSCKVQWWDIVNYLKRVDKFDHLVNLRQIEFDDTGCRDLDRIPILRQNPELQQLSLTDVPFPSPSSLLDEDEEESLNLACYNVAHLSIRVGPKGNMLSAITYFLDNSPDLQTLVMDMTINRSTTATPRIKARTLNLLTVLDITNVEWAVELLSVTTFPSLQTIRLSRLSRTLDSALTAQSNSVPVLTELLIRSCSIAHVDSLIQFLKTAPLLEMLELSSLTDISGKVLEALAPFETKGKSNATTSDNVLCPALTSLNVSYCSDVKTGPLHRLVKARLPSNFKPAKDDTEVSELSPIKSLIVDGCPNVDPEWLPWFRKNVGSFSCVYMTKRAASYRR